METLVERLIEAGMSRKRRKRQEPLIDIIHEDSSIVALNKPPGITSVPGAVEKDGTFYNAVKKHFEHREGEHFTPRMIHRLDKQTSGLMIVGKDTDAERAVAIQFERHQVRKEYLAVVGGEPFEDAGEIDQRIAPGRSNQSGMVIDETHGKEALTRYEVLDRFRGFALLLAKPKTGRTHQIRIHLASIGHPVVVDGIYGSGDPLCLSEFKKDYRPKRNGEERPLIARQALHCYRIGFTSPETSRPLTLEAPLPRDFAVLLKQLNKYGR